MVEQVEEDKDEDGGEAGGSSPFPQFPFGGFSHSPHLLREVFSSLLAILSTSPHKKI